MTSWQKIISLAIGSGIIATIAGLTGWYLRGQNVTSPQQLVNHLTNQPPKPLPLLAYTIPNLQTRQYQASQIQIEKELSKTDNYTAYLFSYHTLGRTMTGQLNVPRPKTPTQVTDTVSAADPQAWPVIVMLRGYVPPELYTTGVGTKNAAAKLAEAGYVTLAPDFFGYGDSDPEPSDTWQARFEKPIAVIELIKTIQNQPTISPTNTNSQLANDPMSIQLNPNQLGIWAHSNGGQIALTTLEVLRQPIPTTLWAPVTAPFPYSILFFTDENDDEGKTSRKWLAQFETDYDVFDFSLTQHLDSLTGPIQLHHGSADEAALQVWSDEFKTKITAENKRREVITATAAAEVSDTVVASESTPTALASALPTSPALPLPPIELTYHRYPGADHNLQPAWQTVIDRDIAFFNQQLR